MWNVFLSPEVCRVVFSAGSLLRPVTWLLYSAATTQETGLGPWVPTDRVLILLLFGNSYVFLY